MGLRFRKSIKIAPGVKLNLNKKSAGVTIGGKGAHYTINSTGKKTASVGIPGTGLSYSTSTGGKKSNKTTTAKTTPTGTSPEMSNEGNGKKKPGCLIWSLIILLIIAVYSYAWIPGIIAMIYLALQKNVEKKYKIRRVLVAFAVVLSSLIVFGVSNSEPTLTDITVEWTQDEYDIKDTPELELIPTPSDAIIDSLSISNNDIATVEYSDGKAIISFIAEGTADISFTANDEIQSNVATITVVDKEAEEQRKREAEEEKARLEAEKKAEEKAKKQAEQEKEEPQEEMVWIPSSGSKYHSRSGCSNMENPTEVTLSKAKSLGYEACGRCH